jgi:hypothetical protein
VPENDISKMKERQRLKIQEIKAALCEAGHTSLDQQARVLGVCRSTTWAILQAHHKSTGLTAVVINRMLQAPKLPSAVRGKILQYAEEKANGLYGHAHRPRLAFLERLASQVVPQIEPTKHR